MGKASNKIGQFVNELNNWIDTQDVQINHLANMVNNLISVIVAILF
jgi:hypothetical protein